MGEILIGAEKKLPVCHVVVSMKTDSAEAEQELAVPLAYDLHPDFGYFCAGPRVRRELRVALVSMLFGMAIGAAIVTIRPGQASETDGVSSNARVNSSGTDTWTRLATGPNLQFKNADEASAQLVEAIKPFPMRMVRVRPSKAASPLAGIPLGRTVPPEPDIVPASEIPASSKNAESTGSRAASPMGDRSRQRPSPPSPAPRSG